MEAILKTFDLTLIDGYLIPVGALFFYILWKLLGKSLFMPYLALIEAREKATVGAEEDARDAENKINMHEEEYGFKISEARSQSVEKKLARIQQARVEAGRIISEAERKAEEQILKTRENLNVELEKARTNVFAEAENLAEELSIKLLTPPVVASATLN